MTPAKYDEYMARALLAEYVPLHLLFSGIDAPVNPMKPDNERIPGRDGLEESND